MTLDPTNGLKLGKSTEEVQVGRVVVTEFVTLDGVVEDPGGAEDFERGGWAFKFNRGDDGDEFKLDETLEAEARPARPSHV